MVIIDLLLIAFIAVFIIDYSGFIEEMDKVLTRALKSRVPLHIPKPFSCSLCTTFWGGLIYLLVTGNFTIPYIALVGVMCFLTPEILSIIYFIKDMVNKAFDTIEKIIGI